jgi:hypothetical protein
MLLSQDGSDSIIQPIIDVFTDRFSSLLPSVMLRHALGQRVSAYFCRFFLLFEAVKGVLAAGSSLEHAAVVGHFVE